MNIECRRFDSLANAPRALPGAVHHGFGHEGARAGAGRQPLKVFGHVVLQPWRNVEAEAENLVKTVVGREEIRVRITKTLKPNCRCGARLHFRYLSTKANAFS
jgi:hypothetical protein